MALILIQKDANNLVPRDVTAAERLVWAQGFRIFDVNADGSRSAGYGPTGPRHLTGDSGDVFDQPTGGWVGKLDINGREQLIYSQPGGAGTPYVLATPDGRAFPLSMTGPQPFSFAVANTPALPSALNQGTKVVDISTATAANMTSASVVSSTTVLSAGGLALQISGNGAGTPQADLSTFGTGLAASFALSSSNKSLGFWAFKPATGSPSPLTFFLSTTSGFGVYSTCNILIYPGLHWYALTFPQTSSNGPGWSHNGGGIFGTSCAYIRIKQNLYANSYGYMANGDYIQIGDLYVDPQQARPRFVFDFDGNNPELVYPGSYSIAGYDGVVRNHSFCSFLATYGWSATAGIITGAVGNISGTMAVRDWQYARDKFGAAIISHTHYHVARADVAGAANGSGGYPLQGPYGFSLVGAVAQTAAESGLQFTPTNSVSGIKADIELAQGLLTKWGFPEGAYHLMLSQGGYDIYTSQALEAYAFKSVRGGIGNPEWVSNALAYAAVPTQTSGQFADCQSYLCNRSMVLQLEVNAVSTPAMQAFINANIAGGGIGTTYTHSFAANANTVDNYKRFCDLLKAAELAGLCDVVTAYAIGAA